MARRQDDQGFVLLTLLFMLTVMLSLMGAYFVTTKVELAQTKYSKDSLTGFYTSEAGLNIRAEEIRQIFVGYNRPSGTSPATSTPCDGNDDGTGDFQCASYTFGSHSNVTYMSEDPSNPIMTTIPPGERYQNLNAQEYRYTVNSTAYNVQNRADALLELRFKSRLVPLFQFQAFYNKDLEILPGPSMTLNGPIHTNGDLYLNTDNASPGMTITGQVTVGGDLFRGRKNTNVCNSNPVRIMDPTNPTTLIPTCSQRVLVNPNNLGAWHNMIQVGVTPVTVPEPEAFDPLPENIYFNKADLRLALKLNASNARDTTNSPTGVEVRNVDGTVNTTKTTSLYNCTCTSCISHTQGASPNLRNEPVGSDWNGSTWSFYDRREGKQIRLLEVNMQGLFNCLHATNSIIDNKLLSDSTEGGLVFHFTVDGPNSYLPANGYGVRLRNGPELRSTTAGAPTIKGLTIVSDQAVYLQGTYNDTNKKPAAIMSDTINVLSNTWPYASENGAVIAWATRDVGSNATIKAAFLAATDSTGGIEGSGGQGGAYNGGLENYPRFHEDWSGRTLTYLGSFVSLSVPRHSSGIWPGTGNPSSITGVNPGVYNPPTRAWAYDTAFNDAANLPPLSPRFVYLRQELFVRDYEQAN